MLSLDRRDGRPLRIGHRGAAALAPENTLASFRSAVDVGVDLVEFDVIELSGGELVVAHSYDLHEVSHGAHAGTLVGMSVEELRERCPDVPSFDDALAFFAEDALGVGAHVDLKSPQAAPGVAEALRRFGLVDRSLVSSFHARALRRLAALEPRLRLGITFPHDLLRVHGRPRFEGAVGASLRGLRAVTPGLVAALLMRSRATALVLQHRAVSARAVSRAHTRGAPVVAWTVDDPADLERVVEAGVDAVVTNDPSIFVSTLEA